jgi:PTS system nitrogen regulatory IIA component
MFPTNFLALERIGCQVEAGSKKRVLELLGSLLADTAPGLTQDSIFDRLLERERLGSTGLGHGIALPHARMRDIDQAYGAFIQLSQGVDFDAIDSEPVDLLFALLVPEAATQEHLQLLATLAGMFSNPEFCANLRRASAPEDLLKQLTEHKLPPVEA